MALALVAPASEFFSTGDLAAPALALGRAVADLATDFEARDSTDRVAEARTVADTGATSANPVLSPQPNKFFKK